MHKTPLIVLAEDNAPDVFLVRTALEQQGFDFQLRVFSDGEEMLNYLVEIDTHSAPCPDLILLDLNLPKCSGQDILKSFRERARCPRAAVIVISSSDSPEDKTSAAKLGVAHFFRKPADLDEFMKVGGVVREVLRDRDASFSPALP